MPSQQRAVFQKLHYLSKANTVRSNKMQTEFEMNLGKMKGSTLEGSCICCRSAKVGMNKIGMEISVCLGTESKSRQKDRQ